MSSKLNLKGTNNLMGPRQETFRCIPLVRLIEGRFHAEFKPDEEWLTRLESNCRRLNGGDKPSRILAILLGRSY